MKLARTIDELPAGTEVTVLSDSDEHGVWTSDNEAAAFVDILLPDGGTMIVSPKDLEE
jgi:hypothetical protein